MLNLVYGEAQVPCYFIFGASIFDNGNNNALVTAARANYPPYGIDFPKGSTGRFTNGRNMGDLIGLLSLFLSAEHLGFDDYIPPFASVNGQNILKGVNYASGSAGILDNTAMQVGARIGMNLQLRHHQTTISSIERILGDRGSTSDLLNKCMYTVEVGNNDYINNYFSKLYPTRRMYTPEQYATLLIQQYSQQLKTLYNYGARKIALFGVPPYGCAPAMIAMHGTNGSSCVDFINKAVQIFNAKLILLVDELNNNLRDAKFIYVNYYQISSTVRTGFKVTNTSCCVVGKIAAVSICSPFKTPCQNRSDYMYWDTLHTTEAANVMIAARSYSAQFPSDTYPIDICRLAQLK
ncbi:hypothetical protein LWI29_033856 [Acer saccharum]|uniref:GDSL esterase/lipase n=1 Tax=Acer saccharum TaxID=4024 RepID=A0AA39S578_ACESA|nr:hypothetical protein LWI29_033856 [Acer saccharum]